MPELPSSWGLKTQQRPDGKLDIVGKDDTGHDYTVRTTDSPNITETDVQEIAAADRETTTAREFVAGVVAHGRKREKDRADELENDFSAIAEDIVGRCTEGGSATNPGMIDVPLVCGMSSAYARGERYWREIEAWKRQGSPLPTGDN
jgi:hypothetical protein